MRQVLVIVKSADVVRVEAVFREDFAEFAEHLINGPRERFRTRRCAGDVDRHGGQRGLFPNVPATVRPDICLVDFSQADDGKLLDPELYIADEFFKTGLAKEDCGVGLSFSDPLGNQERDRGNLDAGAFGKGEGDRLRRMMEGIHFIRPDGGGGWHKFRVFGIDDIQIYQKSKKRAIRNNTHKNEAFLVWRFELKRRRMHSFPFRRFKGIVRLAIATLLLARVAGASDSNTLPLDPKGSSLKFFCESFMHNFHGEAWDFTGSAVLTPEATPPIQKATLRFKTAELTTFIKGRDEKMYEWLHVKAKPEAMFQLQSVRLTGGDYQSADAQHPAQFKVSGTFFLNGASQPVAGTARGWREKDRLVVTGETVVDTLQYGLPQIRVAILTVGTNVKVAYTFRFVLPSAYSQK